MSEPKYRVRQFIKRAGLHFFDTWKSKSVVLGLVIGAGLLAYTSLLPREGFPAIQFPLTLVNGTYFVDDVEQVDAQVVQPMVDVAEDVDGVSGVESTAQANGFSLAVFFEEGVNPEDGATRLEQALGEADLPPQAQLNYVSIDPAAYLNEYDLLLVVQPHDQAPDQSLAELQSEAEKVADMLAKNEQIQSAEVVPLITTATNPVTGQEESRQTNFNYFAEQHESSQSLEFDQAVTVGVDKTDDIDLIELSALVRELAEDIESSPEFATDSSWQSIELDIGADFASSIETQISSLENNMFTGILAVALVSWLLITWRASVITGLFMVSVMAVTMLTLLLVGYSLNTITLFALVLALGLFVDDATIIIEAIVANNKKNRPLREAIAEALYKVAPASIAGSLTTVLVFLPLAFVSGILGEFIRLLPITVIISLLVSLILSLTLIPLLARYVLHSYEGGATTKKAQFENKLAERIAVLPLLLKTRPKVGWPVGFAMFGLSLLSLVGAGYFFTKTEFNIFPPSEDADQININIEFAPGTQLDEAVNLAEQANVIMDRELGPYTNRALYGGFSLANARSANIVVELVSYTERDAAAGTLATTIEQELAKVIGDQAMISARQIDAGPPQEDMPFKVQVLSEDAQVAAAVARDIQTLLEEVTLTRPAGTTAEIAATSISGNQAISRTDGDRYVQVSAGFSADDTSALVQLAQEQVEAEFDEQTLADYGDVRLEFDFGQESESAESFAALQIVFPIAIAAILLLLALQFRSLLQPLLIVVAIPFSLFGVFYGLYATNNALSFFSTVGIIGLIGIAVNNTILLTDYANQERREGNDAVTAIANAVRQRMRPLLTTTLTTIVALLPLALNDPFWEPLAFTIIFGLLSSTILVIFSFPYYYLATEKVRSLSKRLFTKLRQN